MKFYEFFINEALRLEDAKYFVKAWKEEWNKKDSKIRKFYDKIFEKSYDRRKTRILLDGKIESGGAKIKVPKKLETFVKSKGYEISDYVKGLVKKGNTQMRIGKILKDAPVDVQKVYMNDKSRSGVKKSGMRVVVSRSPLDVAGMSTDRGWTSCMDLDDRSNMNLLIKDVKVGTLVAYLIDEKDLNIKNPTARVAIKPFMNDENEILFMMEKVCYGTVSAGIKKQFFDIIDGFLKEINDNNLLGTFNLLSPYADDISKKIYRFDSLKEGQVWEGNLNLEEIDYDITKLPNNFTVTGDLILDGSKITRLPDGLQVGGKLNLSRSKITRLPDGLKVGGDLDLSYTKIIELPSGLKVGGDLDLYYTKITKLSSGLKVGGNLDLSNLKITELPNGLQVGGYLDLVNTKITKLPNGLQVGGNLNLSRSKITRLPDDLKVGGKLNLSRSKIIELPDGLKVDGDLDLSNTRITELPDGLKVGGSLNLYYTKITKLPSGLKVGGKLDLSDNEITELPDDLKVGGDLDLVDTMITKLPNGLKVGGKLILYYTTKITKLPSGLKVGGDLDLSNTRITELPDDLKVGGDLDLSNTEITKLPSGLKVGGKIIGFKGNK